MKAKNPNNIVTIYGKNQILSKVEGSLKKVSAVIPNYNYARYLKERVDSILFQTYPVMEIIILEG